MNTLEQARFEIDSIDKKIARLFEARMEQVKIIGGYKKANNIPICDPKREKELLDCCTAFVQNDEIKPYYQNLLKNIIRLSKEYQQCQ